MSEECKTLRSRMSQDKIDPKSRKQKQQDAMMIHMVTCKIDFFQRMGDWNMRTTASNSGTAVFQDSVQFPNQPKLSESIWYIQTCEDAPQADDRAFSSEPCSESTSSSATAAALVAATKVAEASAMVQMHGAPGEKAFKNKAAWTHQQCMYYPQHHAIARLV